ncbi:MULTISPECIES: 2Fe-2S iron-sulfur cluster-binding protein [unclassified Streptomyces]|nr:MULTISPECIES: 2Fe-2S iron-sulfur cluster-binding protein [unclassified Streptomyces]
MEHPGFPCGFCVAGRITSAVPPAEEGHAGSDEDIRESVSGNICRCASE